MSTTETSKRQLVYDAVLYGLGAALDDLAKSDLGKRFAEEVHKDFGRHMEEYLEKRGVKFEDPGEPEEVVQKVTETFLKDLDFADPDLPTEATETRGTHATWKNLLGTPAYNALAEFADDPFLSCPLNAVLRNKLDDLGYTLVVHGCTADLDRDVLDSWEEVRRQRTFL